MLVKLDFLAAVLVVLKYEVSTRKREFELAATRCDLRTALEGGQPLEWSFHLLITHGNFLSIFYCRET